MGDTVRTYVVPDSQDNNCANLMMPWMAMMSGGMGGFGGGAMWNNPFIYLVWMWMMRWMNNNGDFGNDQQGLSRQLQTLQDQMQDNHNSDLIMQGINGNAAAIREVADKMGCNFNVLNQAICGVRSSIDQLGGQVGYTSERIINAVNSGDCKVIEALNNCCCTTQKTIIELGYQNQLANERQTYQITNSIGDLGRSVERGFCDNAYATKTQTCDLLNTIRDTGTANTNQIIAKLDAMQNQALLDKIDKLREKNSQQAVIINNAQLTATFGLMISQATTPIVAAVLTLQGDINGIKCKLPETVTLPANSSVAVPVSAPFGLTCGLSGIYGAGLYAGSGCNNTLWG